MLKGWGGQCLSPPYPVHTIGRLFADQANLRKPGMSQLWEVFSPLRWASDGGREGDTAPAGAGSPLRHTPGTQGPPHPPGSTSETRCSTCCGWRFSRSPRCSPTRCRPGARGRIRGLQAGTGRSACAGRAPAARAYPKLGTGGDRPQPLTLLGHKLRRYSHLEGGKDGRVVAGHDVIGAAWMAGGGSWVTGPEPWGPRQCWPCRAPPSPGVSLTVGFTDYMGLWV